MNPNTPFVRKLEEQFGPTLVPADPSIQPATNPSRTLLPMSALEVVSALHYGDGAAVAFARIEGAWQECGAILTRDLAMQWPIVEPYLAHDSYFSLASTYEQKRATKISVLDLPIWSRGAKRLRWLNALAVDLDQHKGESFSCQALLESFQRELMLQNIPSPTFICFSGRGLWALWQLKDFRNEHQPVRAFPDQRALAQRINYALVKRLAHLGADHNATDAARVMRLPNSINSKAAPENSRVRFFRASDATYTLPEMASALDVRARKLALPGETRAKDRMKQAAAAMRWRYPLDGFRELWRMRKVFTEGTRRTAIYVYSMLLRKNRATPQQVLSSCLQLAESLVPSVTPDDVRRQIAASEKAMGYNFRNAKLAEMLKITPEEMAALPKWFRPRAKSKSARIAQRRAVITSIIGATEEPLSTRRLARVLKEKHGIVVSQRTVARDLRSLPEPFAVLIEPRVSLCISRQKCHSLMCPIRGGNSISRGPAGGIGSRLRAAGRLISLTR